MMINQRMGYPFSDKPKWTTSNIDQSVPHTTVDCMKDYPLNTMSIGSIHVRVQSWGYSIWGNLKYTFELLVLLVRWLLLDVGSQLTVDQDQNPHLLFSWTSKIAGICGYYYHLVNPQLIGDFPASHVWLPEGNPGHHGFCAVALTDDFIKFWHVHLLEAGDDGPSGKTRKNSTIVPCMDTRRQPYGYSLVI